MLEPAGHGAELGIHAVGQHDKGVVMKQVRNGVLVILEVLLVGRPDVLADILQLHEQQRQPVDEPHDVGPPAVQIAPHPQLPHAEKMVVRRLCEIEHPQPLPHALALAVAERDLHAVLDQLVLFPVCRRQRLGGNRRHDLPDRIVISRHPATPD